MGIITLNRTIEKHRRLKSLNALGCSTYIINSAKALHPITYGMVQEDAKEIKNGCYKSIIKFGSLVLRQNI